MNQHPVITPRKPLPSAGKRSEESARRPSGRMVLCLGGLPNAAVIERYFQERGWKVFVSDSAIEARSLSRASNASVAVLAEEVPGDESGWLTSWKLLHDHPKTQVIVVGTRPAEQGGRFAEFVGAKAYVPATESAAGIGRALNGTESHI